LLVVCIIQFNIFGYEAYRWPKLGVQSKSDGQSGETAAAAQLEELAATNDIDSSHYVMQADKRWQSISSNHQNIEIIEGNNTVTPHNTTLTPPEHRDHRRCG
jgi:hypothetical protein